MSHHLSRAEILLAQSRPADAEREARMALGQAPGDPLALTLLARALSGVGPSPMGRQGGIFF